MEQLLCLGIVRIGFMGFCTRILTIGFSDVLLGCVLVVDDGVGAFEEALGNLVLLAQVVEILA
jgi:hypothetical protein